MQLAFPDGTYLELYGDDIRVAGQVDRGGREKVVEYAHKFAGAQVTSYC